jgi:uncharacterized membrane protein YeaQ/YmgE (transglycosylase-associated protein family)
MRFGVLSATVLALVSHPIIDNLIRLCLVLLTDERNLAHHENTSFYAPMTLSDFLLLLIVAGIIGAIGQSIAGYSRGGCLTSIAVGFIGSLAGIWLARKIGLPDFYVFRMGGASLPVVWSIAGSALFVALISLFGRGRD